MDPERGPILSTEALAGGLPVRTRPASPPPRPPPGSLPDELPQLLSALTINLTPGGTEANASAAGAVSNKTTGPPSSDAPKGAAAGPEWMRKVAEREQQQAAWARDEKAHWVAARDAAVASTAGAPAAGEAVAVPPLTVDGEGEDSEADTTESDVTAALFGWLDLPALRRLTRPSGLAVFCSSTVRDRGGVGSPWIWGGEGGGRGI